jgi:hypothetical protein
MVSYRLLLGAALAAALSAPLLAQEAPTGFHTINCVKVRDGKSAEFRAWVEGPVQKVAQSGVDSGRIAGWLALHTQIPQGSDAQCDWALVTFYKGLPNEPLSADGVTDILHKAGVAMTAKEYYEKRDAISYLVYNNITQYQALVGQAKKGGYLVFNSITAPDAEACVSYEKKVWQPLAEEMLKDGSRSGWAINQQVFPNGNKDRTAVSTVDLFPSWDAVMKQGDGFVARWKKVHPDMELGTTFEQFQKLCSIDNTVLYKVEYSTGASK